MSSPAGHPAAAPGHSVLQVPVPPLEPWVRQRTAFYDTDYLSTDPAFTHAHVTALAPFLPEVDDGAAATVAAIVADTRAFDFTLGGMLLIGATVLGSARYRGWL